ncbi:tetratricopeptide repeat protein [Streptococcus suis]|uniref:tetratricopeptide repeat protein n=1 Tax=Streptococcus suis TaxID=1307 RepID=UPI001ABE8F26|nr:sel1 repeat family protein [Streptococcus suis]
MNSTVELSAADYKAIERNDSRYLNSKGANYYREGQYNLAAAYYHLAASMGNSDAMSNLGYCYLCGRHTDPNLSLAIAFFKLAAKNKNIDATYKLGDIYGATKWGIQDEELSIYYYRLAVSYILDEPLEALQDITWCQALKYYPSLCLVLGKAMLVDGQLFVNIDLAYQFLMFAQKGYEIELQNRGRYYQSAYEQVLKLLEDPQFDSIRSKWDSFFEVE